MADEGKQPPGGDLPGDYPTEYERGLQKRLFSEVTDFPLEFRNWLKKFIESSDILLSQNQISPPGPGFPPLIWGPGIIIPYAGGTAPPNSLPCNGAALSRTTYKALFDEIGTLWGPGDGSTTFNVPDFRDRALYGQGSKVSLAGNEGGALGTRGPRHSHTFSGNTGDGGDHTHTVSATAGAGGSEHRHDTEDGAYFAHNSGGTIVVNSASGTARYYIQSLGGWTANDGAHSHAVSGGTNGSGNHAHGFSGTTTGGGVADAPGYAGVLYLITTGTIS